MATITVTLNKCGGTGGDPKAQYLPAGQISGTTNIPQGTPSSRIKKVTIPTKSSSGINYKFLGYYVFETGGIQYFDSTGKCVHNIDFDKNTTLYAHWGNTIKSTVVWSVNDVYCTDSAYEASSTTTTKTVDLNGNTDNLKCIESSDKITYSITDATTKSNGFTISNGERKVTINKGTRAGDYTIKFNIISPGQDGIHPNDYKSSDGYYYFPDTVQATVTVKIIRTLVHNYKDISIDFYNYNEFTGLYKPPQHTLVPATEVELELTNWEDFYDVPLVYQRVEYNNGAVGLKRVENYIYGASPDGNLENETQFFSDLGTTTLPNNVSGASNVPSGIHRVKFTNIQRRYYVTEMITRSILEWIASYCGISIPTVSYSIDCSYPLGLLGLSEAPVYSSSMYNRSSELVEYICTLDYVWDYGGLKQQLCDYWSDFVTVCDLILFVQGSMTDGNGTTYVPFIMERGSALRNGNKPTLSISIAKNPIKFNESTTATVTATYPSGAVRDITDSLSTSSSATSNYIKSGDTSVVTIS